MQSLIPAFAAASTAGCLSQPEVAREAVWMLTHYHVISPPVLQNMAVLLGMSRTYESGDMIARWLEDDGWIQKQTKPWVGSGMGAVWAYEPTDKWKKLVEP